MSDINPNTDPKIAEIARLTEKFDLKLREVTEIKNAIMDEFNRGLSPATHAKADIKMYPTFVRDIPRASEKGRNAMALDLGGTNMRVLNVVINQSMVMITDPEPRSWRIENDLMTGSGEALFDHIAECIAAYIEDHKERIEIPEGSRLPLGFTFSFPCEQHGLASAKLVRWTKGFTATGVVGEDVGVLLNRSLEKLTVPVEVKAIINDTTGTLMACGVSEENCRIGLIVGTGTNAAFMEKLERVKTWKEPPDNLPPQVIINTEWGAFGERNPVLPKYRTEFDKQVDEVSANPGRQLYEKMVSGMYLGELTRLIMIKAAEEKLLFAGRINTKLRSGVDPRTGEKLMDSRFLSQCEQDLKGHYGSTRRALLETFDIDYSTDDDCRRVQFICQRVSTRAAQLVAAGLCAILQRLGRHRTVIAVDGSLYKKHPNFSRRLDRQMYHLNKNDGYEFLKFRFVKSDDGSGKGAAAVAAIACRDWDSHVYHTTPQPSPSHQMSPQMEPPSSPEASQSRSRSPSPQPGSSSTHAEQQEKRRREGSESPGGKKGKKD